MRPSFLVVMCLAASACGDDSQPTGGSGQGGGDAVCEQFREPETAEPEEVVTVRLRNDSAAPIFIGETTQTCNTFFGYQVENEGGAVKTDLFLCEFTCSEMLDQPDCGCPALCEVTEVVMIEPGGSFETSWAKTMFVPQVMDAGCWANYGCFQNGCFERTEPTGALTFIGSASAGIADCFDDVCTCTPDASGSCVVSNTFLVDPSTVAEATATWNPGDTEIEIVFP